ncbi:SQOR-like protein [Mya arenaria]|uniref:SQOR-like protein n=1 Tax=Mya arenaria TaxID=6604 RepID=A0ABY7FBB6_MYAAR|nr:SQOR-like protein [Mya arenaria]
MNVMSVHMLYAIKEGRGNTMHAMKEGAVPKGSHIIMKKERLYNVCNKEGEESVTYFVMKGWRVRYNESKEGGESNIYIMKGGDMESCDACNEWREFTYQYLINLQCYYPFTLFILQYDFLHVAPPMSAPDILKNSTSPIVDASGFLDVNKLTCQHNKFPNIFGVGDCTNIPTAKTAAAIASQNKIVHTGIKEVEAGKQPSGQTFPLNQAKERRTMFHMKKDIMPEIYWNMLLNIPDITRMFPLRTFSQISCSQHQSFRPSTMVSSIFFNGIALGVTGEAQSRTERSCTSERGSDYTLSTHEFW